MTRARAFTLIEILVAIAMVGILLMLLLPAVQAAREAARGTQCKNHLKQLSLGFLQHEQAWEAFPSGGWGHVWMAVPGRGIGVQQPAAWPYQILPYIGEQALFELGRGLSGDAWGEAYELRVSTAVEFFHCPTRREAALYPYTNSQLNFMFRPFVSRGTQVAKNDYAASIGDAPDTCCPERPYSIEHYDSGQFTIPDMSDHTGVSHAFSWVRFQEITDGGSQTYMLGEKLLNPDAYFDGDNGGDDESLYHGHNSDLYRSTRPEYGPPRQDESYVRDKQPFGSAHATGCNFAMCDGSVRTISYLIDAETHRQLGNRHDGGVVEFAD